MQWLIRTIQSWNSIPVIPQIHSMLTLGSMILKGGCGESIQQRISLGLMKMPFSTHGWSIWRFKVRDFINSWSLWDRIASGWVQQYRGRMKRKQALEDSIKNLDIPTWPPDQSLTSLMFYYELLFEFSNASCWNIFKWHYSSLIQSGVVCFYGILLI